MNEVPRRCMREVCRRAIVAGMLAAGAALTIPASGDAPAVLLRLDNLQQLAGHPLRVVGSPRVVTSELGAVVEFNGRTDGLFLDINPLIGLGRFTIEVVFQPDADGPEEQRFLHFEERGTGNRALIELRMSNGRWALDTYLRTGETGLTLLDRGISHPAGEWHTAALTYDGKTMAHYVDGVREQSGAIAFPALKEGSASIGVRQNQVSWFKGRIHSVRISPDALPPGQLLRMPHVQGPDAADTSQEAYR